MKKKLIAGLVIIAVLFGVYSVYSMSKTLLQLYPTLTLDKCVGISGYYRIGTQEESTQFVIQRDDEEFEDLCSQFLGTEYRRSLRDLLPRGTRYHAAEEDDFQWNVYFTYEDVELPDGSRGSGEVLYIQNWYGELDIHFDDEVYSCYTKKQDAWLEDVLEICRKVN